MLDELRQQIQTYLDQLLGEADKLRHALVALGSRDRAATPSAAPSPAPERARRRSGSAPASRKPARPRAATRERSYHYRFSGTCRAARERARLRRGWHTGARGVGFDQERCPSRARGRQRDDRR
ncbi:MAG TPA: hypothetical protein VNR42_09940 [Solirubrobacteraceae bacterium]|nr:hypothetical protein [Solirubrobacteraceae bacterium]